MGLKLLQDAYYIIFHKGESNKKWITKKNMLRFSGPNSFQVNSSKFQVVMFSMLKFFSATYIYYCVIYTIIYTFLYTFNIFMSNI